MAPRAPDDDAVPAVEHATEQSGDDDVLLFLATLGSALSAIGETVDAVETRLAVIAHSVRHGSGRSSATSCSARTQVASRARS